MTPFAAGLIAIVVVLTGCYFAFTQAIPFQKHYKLYAIFQDAHNLQPKSVVRIAGVDVGKVTSIQLMGKNGPAKVAMQIDNKGLPIHQDAQLKLRPRIFLEGNLFVDVQPGSPSAPKAKSGYVVPMTQTAAPVQLENVLYVLQSNTRSDLQTLLKQFAKGLNGGGSQAFNRSIPYWGPAYRNSSLANEATLGKEPHDFSKLMRGQAITFHALARDDQALKDLVTNFNITAGAFAREADPLERAIPALRDVLRVGSPALESLNAALPSLRHFARDALPGTKSSGPTLDASIPFIRQARALMSKAELRGLVADLRPTIPALAKANAATVPFLNESRALGACTSKVLVPFATTPIPDPDFPANSGQPFYKQSSRGLVGLAGESRINDANTPLFHVQQGGGPFSAVQTDESGTNRVPFGGLIFPIEGTRPARPDKRPVFRPNVPCETQQPPNMNAPSGPADPTRLAHPSAPTPFTQLVQKYGTEQAKQIAAYIKAAQAGHAVGPDPLSQPYAPMQQALKQQLDMKLTTGGLRLEKLTNLGAGP